MTIEDLRKQAKKAQERKDIFPKLQFGEETEEGDFYVRFEQSVPKEFTNPKPLPGKGDKAFQIIVTLLEPSPYQNAGGPLTISTGAGGTLGDGILKMWQANNEDLMGKVALIQTRYVHIKSINKKARVYSVSDVTKTFKPKTPA